MNIPAGRLKPGIYQVLCCMQYCLRDGRPGPIVGFEEKGFIKIYEDKRPQSVYPATNGLSGQEPIVAQ